MCSTEDRQSRPTGLWELPDIKKISIQNPYMQKKIYLGALSEKLGSKFTSAVKLKCIRGGPTVILSSVRKPLFLSFGSSWNCIYPVSLQVFWTEWSRRFSTTFGSCPWGGQKVSRRKNWDGCLPWCKALNHYPQLHAILLRRTHTETRHLASTMFS